MTIVAIHQPNYAPWLGYFYKIAAADIFVFLDDVQFSKGSYINRVQIRGGKGARWLTQPVTVSLGMSIKEVVVAKPDWRGAHLDSLHGAYRTADAFKSVWPDIEAIYAECPGGSLAAMNRKIIEALASRLGVAAVEGMLNGENDVMAGMIRNQVKYTPLSEAIRYKNKIDKEAFRVAKILSI